MRILEALRDGQRRRSIEIWHELRDLSPQTITNAMARLHAEGVVKRAPIHHKRVPLYVYWIEAAA